MNRNKRAESANGKKENEDTQIPKPSKFPTAKANNARTLRSSKTIVRTTTVHSSKEKQTHITSHPKNVKPMSIAKISKDVMNHLQIENQKLEDYTTEFAAGVPNLEKESTTKGVELKEISSQTTQHSGKLQKKPSTSDLKNGRAFGGLKFIPKKNTCQKTDAFETLKNNLQDKHSTEPGTKEMNMGNFDNPAECKDIEWPDNANSENTPPNKAESSKATAQNLKETALKNSMALEGIVFNPKWKSTPLKPDLFGNLQKEIELNDKELFPTDTSKRLEKNLDSKKVITKEATGIEAVTVNGTVQPRTKDIGYPASPLFTKNEAGENVCTAFAGLRMKPKRKSTQPKPDKFEKQQMELKNDKQELNPSDAVTEQEKMPSVATNTQLITEAQASEQLSALNQPSTLKVESLKTVSLTLKELSQLTAYGGIRFAPQWKSTPIRPDILDRAQKESKTDYLKSDPSVTKELKKKTDTTWTIRKSGSEESAGKKLKAPSIQKPGSSKIGVKKNGKDNFAQPVPTFAGLRFKPRQKNRHDVFEALKVKAGNQAQSQEKK